MKAQNPNMGVLAMSLVKKCFLSSKHCVFALLFILSNLLFFQPTQAQISDPYSSFTCDNESECPWVNDSLIFRSPPGSHRGHDCYATLYYKHRVCNGILELQPMSVRFLEDCNLQTSADTVHMFYGDTNVTQRMEQMLKNGENYLVNYYFKLFYDPITDPQRKFDYSVEGDSTYPIKFYRPACRGICIFYGRANSSSPITSEFAKWYNCGTNCCAIIGNFAFSEGTPDPFDPLFTPLDYVRKSYTYELTETCTTYTPNTSCPNTSFNTIVTRFHPCRNYCTDSDGFQYGPDGYDPFGLPNLDRGKNGLINMNEMPYISDKIMQSLPNEIMLEATSNDVVVSISEDVLTVKIISLSGVELQKYSKLQGKVYQSISVQSLQNGLYMLVFETKSGIVSKPLIIAK